MGTFDWENLAEQVKDDALNDDKKKGYEEDSRFYKLSKDKNGNGGALIRLLPDPDLVPFIKMIRIDANGGYNKRFCAEWSPQSIDKPDPFNEKFLELWRAGKKEQAKKFGRKERYIMNIKVIKDPANPENEGKIFLLDMSKTLFGKVKAALKPSEDELAIDPDLKPKKVFDPVNGNSMLLKVKNGENGFVTFDDSRFADKVDGIYASDEEALKDIKANAYSLKEFKDPKNFKTYEELQDCLNWFQGLDSGQETKTETKAEPADELEIDTGLGTSGTSEPTEAVEEKVEEKPEKPETPKAAPSDDDLDALLDEI